MNKINFNNAVFVKSAADSKDFITTSMPKIVFAGKSNVGKSSVINRIVNRKNFARVGNTPGKTVFVNYFRIDDALFFIDLPGYGFAKVSKSEKERWAGLMSEFFASNDSFDLGLQIVDIRHNPTADDIDMFKLLKQSGKKVVVCANKYDKIKPRESDKSLLNIRSMLGAEEGDTVIAFSAETGFGLEKLISAIVGNI